MIGCTFLFTGKWGDNWGNLFKGGGAHKQQFTTLLCSGEGAYTGKCNLRSGPILAVLIHSL